MTARRAGTRRFIKGHALNQAKTAKWIAHPADRWNAARALAAPFLLFAPFVTDFFAGYEIIYAAVTFVLIGDTNYLLHLHIHRPLSRKPALNLLSGRWMCRCSR